MLEQINHPNDIKKIERKDYRLLAEIRKFLLMNVSRRRPPGF